MILFKAVRHYFILFSLAMSVSAVSFGAYNTGGGAHGVTGSGSGTGPIQPTANSAAGAYPVQAQSTKSYRAWKIEKADQIMARIGQTKTQIEVIKAKKAASFADKRNAAYFEGLLGRYEKQLSQEQWNLEVARDLSVTDYIVLYLAGNASKTRFLEAASQMGPVEVAEMIEAYSMALGAANTPDAMVSSTAPAGDMKQAKAPVGSLNPQK